ncbi:hypothetical protein Nepgr_029509 [Nepenthes gracilis]|uniref:Glycoside hydrolase family 3 C-terminal domain-containing protein n=1 Tax=Nepenthes gracilis TaxID=150966 RepID=A0AAD3TF25_NEPGR|nr:hypothetical protein Nepgr_029509 [Nepenthes gracilis]
MATSMLPLSLSFTWKARGDPHHKVCSIPVSAHGINPASAASSGMKIVFVGTDVKGNINMEFAHRVGSIEDELMEFVHGKIVLALEGGYSLPSVANSVLSCVKVLLDGKPIAGSSRSYSYTFQSTSAAAFYVVEADLGSSHDACVEHQIVIWFILPATRNPQTDHNNNALALIDLLQYVLRLYQIFPLNSQIVQTTGVITKTAWAGAAYNLLLYTLAGHVLGAAWYLLSIEQYTHCWKSKCTEEHGRWEQLSTQWVIVLLCFTPLLLCHMDRTNRSIARLPKPQEFNWKSVIKEDESSDPDHESGAIIPVSHETLSHHIPPLTNSRCLPISNLPDPISMIIQTKVFLDRIASFISLEDLQPDITERIPRASSDIAVEIILRVCHGLRVANCGAVRTVKGESSVCESSIAIFTKSSLPLTDKYHGLTDQAKRHRQRYVDMIANSASGSLALPNGENGSGLEKGNHAVPSKHGLAKVLLFIYGTPYNYTIPLQGLPAWTSTNYPPGCVNMACATAQIEDAKKVAAAADVTVLRVGADQSIEAESRDRVDLLLPGQQQLLDTEVAKASQGPLILVIMSGSGFGTSSAKDDDKVSSILWVGHPGEAGEAAISPQRFDEEKHISNLDEIFMIIQDDIDCYHHLSKGATTWVPEVWPIKKDAVFVYVAAEWTRENTAVLGFCIFSFIHKKLTTKGPMAWPIIGMVPSFVLHFHELHEWNTRALIKSGGTYYFDIMMGNCHGVVTSDPAKVEYMLKTRFSNFPKGKYYRERFRDLLGDGIFNADGDVWKEQRRIATSEMHTSRFLEYSAKIMQDLMHKKFLKLIEKKVFSGDHVIDLQEWLLRFTFDNVCVVAFGVDPGCLALNLPEIPFAKAFEEATEYSLRRFLVPPFMWKSMKFFNLGTEKQLKGAIKVVHEFAETAVKNRKADIGKAESSINNQDDLLSRLIKIQQDHMNLQQGKKSHFSDKFLRDFSINFILAGRDTSSVALTWFFWLLHKNPVVENKILTEIDEIIAKMYTKPRELNDIVFQTAELEKMIYLQAALSEAMRLYPPVPIDFKEVQEDDMYQDGMRIRKGDQVFYHTFAMGRMESIWGKDCNEFKPERWIKDGEFVSENQFKYAVFNGGPRLCVGKKFAYVQMKMIAASILLRYKVKVAEGQVTAPKVTTTLYMKHGLLVTFQPRLNLF